MDVVWVDFGYNIGQEFNDIHPAIILYTIENSGTAVVVPLTSKQNHKHNNFIINIGQIDGLNSSFSYAKVDQIKSISKLRIQIKKIEMTVSIIITIIKILILLLKLD
jgi:mRNA interferase MazF